MSSESDDKNAWVLDNPDPDVQRMRAESKARMDKHASASNLIDLSTVEELIAVALRVTGMTRERLEEEWEEAKRVGADAYKQRGPVPRNSFPSRDAVKARGVPEKHLKNIYDASPEPCQALSHVRVLLDTPNAFLVLSGGVGTRKTGSACTALIERNGAFVMAADLASMRASNAPDIRQRFHYLQTCDMLVIDDLGREFLDEKGFWFGTFEGLIDRRYASELKTIMTCNLTKEKFKERYKERVADRIRESGQFVAIAGASVRPDIASRRAGERE